MIPTLSAEIGIENWLRLGQQETWMNMDYILYSILRIDRAIYCIHTGMYFFFAHVFMLRQAKSFSF